MTLTRKEQKQQTKEHLLQVAYQEFSDKGILSTRTLDIAQSAGVAHGTLFVHFPTRENLLIHVIEKFGMQIGEKFKDLSSKKSGVKKILGAHLEILEEYEPFYARLVIEGPLLPAEVRNTIFMIQSGIAHYLEEAAKYDFEKKLIRHIPIHLLLNTWLGLLHYYLANRDLFAPKKSVIKTKGIEILNHFMSLLKL